MNDYLTKDKIQKFKEAFQTFDKDYTGYITIEELGELMNQLGQNISVTELYDIVNEVDNIRNGSVEFNVFIEIMSRKMRDTDDRKENIIQALKVFDKDGNGLISSSELKQAILSFSENTDQEVEEIMKMADIDCNGFINYIEFVRMIEFYYNN